MDPRLRGDGEQMNMRVGRLTLSSPPTSRRTTADRIQDGVERDAVQEEKCKNFPPTDLSPVLPRRNGTGNWAATARNSWSLRPRRTCARPLHFPGSFFSHLGAGLHFRFGGFQLAAGSIAAMWSASSSSGTSFSLTTRPRTETPASCTVSAEPDTKGCHQARSPPSLKTR